MEGMIRGRTIGQGATATVYLATTFSGELFAAKSAELSVSSLLQREQKIHSQLNSPHIVKYLGSSITHERTKLFYNLFTEYVSGGSLFDLIQRQKGGFIKEPKIRSYTKDILLGLDYLHSNFVVHCDIKSRNILIGEDGAKIADLGCSKKSGNLSDLGFTGTPIFMAPEVARGEDQSFPADVWAIGCTVIEMATGSFNPWPEITDPVSALYRIGYTGDFPEYPTSLSDDGRDFLNKCFERDPVQRWTVKQLLRHPFVNYLEKTIEFTGSSSPFSVLDHGFWVDLSVVSEARRNVVNLLSSGSSSPADRMRNLAGDGHDLKDWSLDEDCWVSVRSLEENIGEFVVVVNEGESGADPATRGTDLGLDPSGDDDDEDAWSFDFNYWGDDVISNLENNSPLIIFINDNCNKNNLEMNLLLLLSNIR
ncbi:mitogen-activated protein kinase kinase kinase 18-like [Impatiens glandulifera]|uniref:mitogen-activated protein kinase kinase kinase 18-like n=1 Tax=Impatiens glandulifera TaxID=253017 RepID=UPI001FB0B4D1|nr:mitogen-activated protein kinase kinase kinase 18-like [Impatiens glandulifera]